MRITIHFKYLSTFFFTDAKNLNEGKLNPKDHGKCNLNLLTTLFDYIGINQTTNSN